MQFRWIDWNLEHIAEHGVDKDEAEMVVRNAKPPLPEEIGNEKMIVRSRKSENQDANRASLGDDHGRAA